MGKTANGQVVVTTVYADPHHAWPVNGQLYLNEEWCQDTEGRKRAGIPTDLTFQTKPAIALRLIDEAREAGVPFGLVVSDGAYADNPTFLDGLEARHLPYIVAVGCDFGVRLPCDLEAAAGQPSPCKKKVGRPRLHPDPVSLAPRQRADTVLAARSKAEWQTITWRVGSDGPLRKQFMAVRVYRAVGETTKGEGWLMGERPLPGHQGDSKFYFSDLPATTALPRLVELVHRRPIVDRGYQDGKGHTGLDDYAARKWDSLHRHLAVEMMVLSWLTLQRPPGAKPVIVTAPQAVPSPDEPFFPLRA